MPTLITQDDFEPKLLPNPNLTMTIPALASLPVAQFPKKKMLQTTLFGKVAPPSPETKSIQVQGYNRSSTQVQPPLRKINPKPHGNKKDSKATKFKKKAGKPKHSAFPHNGQDDCKESVQLAKTLQIQEPWDLMNRSRK
jgi:hypothetical protein